MKPNFFKTLQFLVNKTGTKLTKEQLHQLKLVKKATKDGFILVGGCAEDPKLGGGMGIHYLHPKRVDNPKLAGDKTLIPEEPELLLYAPDKNGKLKLIGVEYMVSKA